MIKSERIEIEENKEEIIPRHGMQTRSQGPPSFGEKIQQEIYDPIGNLTWKGSVYKIPNMGDYRAYDVVVNLIHKASGNNKTFKNNFVDYAREKEGDHRSYDTNDNKGFITKAVEILEKELNNDKPSIAMAMKYFIENNPKAFVWFQDLYNTKSAKHLKK